MLIVTQEAGVIFGWTPSQVEALAALISVVLTALIILVYREQVKLKKLEQRPIIAATSYKEYGTDFIAVKLKNYGQGSATEIEVRTIVSPIDTREITSPRDRFVTWLKDRIPKSASFYPDIQPMADNGDSESEEWQQPIGARIAPSESGQYVIEISMKTNPNWWPDALSRRWQQLRPWLPGTNNRTHPNVLSFMAANEDLQEHVDDYRLRVIVRPTTEFGKEKSEIVFDYVIPAVEGLPIEDALEYGMPYKEFRANRTAYAEQTAKLR